MEDSRTRVLIVFGTRPEAIKMAPLVHEFKKHPELLEVKVCITAQHREMLDQVMTFFNLVADYDLDVMKQNQTLTELTSNILIGMQEVLEDFQPDYTFVHGDTTTTMTTSLAAFYAKSKVCHIEAGLRTYDLDSPFPEEANRQVTGRLTSLHFAPTPTAKENLLRENILDTSIFVTGNTVIDALFYSVERVREQQSAYITEIKERIGDAKIILVTGHRRENHGEGIINICESLKEIALMHPEYKIVYPVHLNPNILKPVNEILGGVSNVLLLPPLDYPDFIWMMDRSKIIITDSGGIQEEAPSLGKPVLVMRKTTERPEAVEAGTVKLVGTDKAPLVSEIHKLLMDKTYYGQMSMAHNPYGDGNACKRIVQTLLSQIQ